MGLDKTEALFIILKRKEVFMKKAFVLIFVVVNVLMAYGYYQKVVYYNLNYTTQTVETRTWKEVKITDNVYYLTPVVHITREYIPVVEKRTCVRKVYIPEKVRTIGGYRTVENYYPVNYSSSYEEVYKVNYSEYYNQDVPSAVIHHPGVVKYYYQDGTIIIVK